MNTDQFPQAAAPEVIGVGAVPIWLICLAAARLAPAFASRPLGGL
jgi:hypothetical protein